MNKSKKELYEENKMLKKNYKILDKQNREMVEQLSVYSEFWETDAIEECTKQLRFVKKSMYITSVILLIISAFLLGLTW
jgi:hypothetical protein